MDNNVNKLREAKELSQGDLERLSGVNRQHISKIERGDRPIMRCTVYTAYRLAQSLGCTIDDLIGDDAVYEHGNKDL